MKSSLSPPSPLRTPHRSSALHSPMDVFRRRGLLCSSGVSPGGNRSQQESTTHGDGLARATKINTIQQSQQKSAKVSKISPGPPAQSAKVIKNHHKSSEIITGTRPQSSKIINSQHSWFWFVNRLEFFSDQTARIGT